MRVLGFFLPEMAIVSSQDVIPGLVKQILPPHPLESAEDIDGAARKTLYLYRFKMIIENLSEH